MLYAFDLIEHIGADLRDLPLIERKRRLNRLLGRAKRRSIQYSMHLKGDRCSIMSAAWGWRASCQSGWVRPIAAVNRVWLKSLASDAERREREVEKRAKAYRIVR